MRKSCEVQSMSKYCSLKEPRMSYNQKFILTDMQGRICERKRGNQANLYSTGKFYSSKTSQ